jgi:N-acetylneuraminic acid mutarotase
VLCVVGVGYYSFTTTTGATQKMKWIKATQLGNIPNKRSSHSIAVLHEKIYLIGGELEPRVPIDNDLYVYDMNSHEWNIVQTKNDNPYARLAHTTVTIDNKLFMYGGRNKEGTDLNELHMFDTETGTWTELASNVWDSNGRSYHSATNFTSGSNNNKLFVFGGCSSKGRLNTLMEFDAQRDQWTELTSKRGNAPSACGGPGFSSVGDSLLYVFGGFNGKELGDLHVFDYRDHSWNDLTNQMTGDIPEERSVHVMCTLDSELFVFGGEREPSKIGHAGAGEFFDDSFIFYPQINEWKRVTHEATLADRPSARGWLNGVAINDTTAAVFGGYNEHSRLNDLYFFQK